MEQGDPYSDVIREEKEKATLDAEMEDIDMENETNVDEMEAMDQDSQILANLNILQENMDHPAEY